MPLLKGKNPAPKSKKDKPKSIERKAAETKTLKRILESITIKKAGELLFTEDQIGILLSLTFADSTPFLSLKTDILYEFIGGCEKIKREEGNIDELIQLTQAELLVATLETYNVIDKALWFKNERGYYEREIARFKTKIIVKRGIFKCPQCLASKEGRDPTNTNTVEIQTRSGDEPITNFNDCNNCGYRWKV